jgi:putative membrane protein
MRHHHRVPNIRWNATTFRTESTVRSAALWLLALVIAGVIVILLATRADARQPVALDDAGVVAIFDLANTADIETGQLGAKRAQNTEVREYARMLADVHTAVRQQGRELAAKLGVTPKLPEGDRSAAQHAETLARLSKLHGAEFDRAFLEHEKAFHIAVLSAVKSTLLPAIKNQELKNFVVSLAPAFQAHQLAAENLLKKTAASE